jgi:SWI/SNF related-matrix-associated actin-dependent regulator of chromatin subfamily C
MDQWTDQETLLLLEGIELYTENWDQISEHVGSKTKEQCLLHFIRLPVEDSFIENHFFSQTESSDHSAPAKTNSASETNDNDMDTETTTTVKEEPLISPSNGDQLLANKLTPFSSASNPLMMMVAFLASSVNPAVASAAAHAALESLTKKEDAKEDDSSSDPEKAKEEAPALTKQGLQTATAAALSAAVLKSKVWFYIRP